MDLTIIVAAITVAAVITGAVLLQRQEQREDAQARRRRRERQDRLIVAYDDLMAQHAPTLRVRLDQALYQDAYGRWIADKARKELAYFWDQVLLPELRPQFEEDYELVKGRFAEWVEAFDSEPEDISSLLERLGGPRGSDGRDYERLVGLLLELAGFQVRFTQVTGDQGVDLLAERDGETIAVQCKDYSKPAGNDAVQQAFAGAKFYGADKAMVVAPSDFTVAARQLAASLGVRCLHHGELFEVLGMRPSAPAAAE